MSINYTRYSAEVTIHVEHGGTVFQVAQLGPDFLVLENAGDVDGAAELILSVDGVTCRRDVRLQDEGTSGEKKILFPVIRPVTQLEEVHGKTGLSVQTLTLCFRGAAISFIVSLPQSDAGRSNFRGRASLQAFSHRLARMFGPTNSVRPPLRSQSSSGLGNFERMRQPSFSTMTTSSWRTPPMSG